MRYTFINSESEIKRFLKKIVKPWKNIYKNERGYMVLAARQKYLSEENKKIFNLNKTMMMERKLLTYSSNTYLKYNAEYSKKVFFNYSDIDYQVKESFINDSLKNIDLVNSIIDTIKRWERIGDLYKAPSKIEPDVYKSIPESVFVVYFYINPIDLNKFYQIFTDTTIKDLNTTLLNTINKYPIEINYEHVLDIYQRLSKIVYFSNVNYSQSVKSTYWKDIDIDFYTIDNKKYFDIEKFNNIFKYKLRNSIYFERDKKTIDIDELYENSFYMIDTLSGYHFGFESQILKLIKNGPQKIIDIIKEVCIEIPCEQYIKEIIENKNYQVPLPGTYQKDHKIKMLF